MCSALSAERSSCGLPMPGSVLAVEIDPLLTGSSPGSMSDAAFLRSACSSLVVRLRGCASAGLYGGSALLHGLEQGSLQCARRVVVLGRDARLAAAWLMARPGLTASIASATSLDQMRDLAAATRLHLVESDIERLDQASAGG